MKIYHYQKFSLLLYYILVANMKENKRQHQSSFQQLLDSYCQVCFVPFNKIAPRKLEQGEEICYCVQCKCRVHTCCYDMSLSFNFVTTKIREFTCQRCKIKQLNDKACIVCHKKEGALKIIDGNELVHVFCALMHKDIITTNYYQQLIFKKSSNYKQVRNLCGLCSKPNATEQCSMESCMKRYHGYCIWLNLKAKELEEQEPQCSKYYLSNGDNGKFDLTGEPMSKAWVFEQFDKAIATFEQYGFKPHDYQKIKNQVYNKYEKQEKQLRDDSTLRRGGFAYILCEDHQMSVYCNCFNKGYGDMVLCECCFQWYHQKCVGYQPGKTNKNGDHYICTYCQNFYDLKKKIIQQVRSSRTENYQLKFEPPKMHINDYIWILRVIDLRIANGGAAKMIKQLAKYPLKTSKMDLVIRSQNKKKMAGLVENFTQQYLHSEGHQAVLKPRPVLGLDNDQKPIVLEQNVEYNKKLKKYIEFIQNFVRRGILTDSFGPIIHELKFKQRALDNSYDTISQLSKSQSGYSQIPILKMKMEEYSFMQVLKNIGSGSLIQFQQLEDAVNKTKGSSNVPIYLIKPLIQRYEKVKSLVELVNKNIYEKRQCSNQTQNAVKKLKEQKILAPQSYNKFHQQRKFIKELYLFYLKQQGKPLEQSVDTEDKIRILLTQPACKPNREISDCVNSFNLGANSVHEHIVEIIDKYSKVCLIFELKDILKKGVIRLSALQNLFAKYERLKDYQGEHEIKNFMENWKNTRKLWIETKQDIQSSISQLDDIVGLTTKINNIQETIKSLANLSVEIADKAEEVPQLSSVNKLDQLKNFLDTLMTLFTESQLKKNPMTISKLPQGIPKQNPLVQQYFSLKKQQNQLLNKYNAIYTRINQKIQLLKADPKKPRKQQMKDNLQKPRMTDINNFIDQLKDSKINMQNQIRELTKTVNKCIEIGSKVNKFLQQQKHIQNLFKQEQIDGVKKQIDQYRKKILTQAEISLQNQLKQLYQAQICIRMQKMVITSNAQIDKMSKLLKFAEEEGLTHLATYKKLKSKFQIGNESNKQISLTKKHEQMLNAEAQKIRDFDNFYSSLVNLRKSLPLSIPQTLKQKNKHYQDLSIKNDTLRKKIQFILMQEPKKYEIQQAQNIYLQALKHPFQIQGLAKLINQFQKAQKILSIWKESKYSLDSYDPIFIKSEDLIFRFEEIQILRKKLRQCQNETIKIKQLRKDNIDINTVLKVESCLKSVSKINIPQISKSYNKFKIQYFSFWKDFLQKIKIEKQYEPITYFKINAMLADIYTQIQNNLKANSNTDSFRQIVSYFEDLMVGIRKQVIQKGQSIEPIYQGFIDIYELKYDAELGYDVRDQIKILNPYNDPHRFSNIDLQKAYYRQPKTLAEQPIALKRQRTDNSEMEDPYTKAQKIQKTHKKLIQSDSKIDKKIEDWEKNDSNIVSQAQRVKAKEVIFKNIKKNKQLANIENLQQQVRMIENQLFGDNHNQVVKYFEFVNSFEKLFIKLVSCPNISAKVAKKKFQWSFLKLLIDNIQQINQIQTMLVQKNKQSTPVAPTIEKKQSIKQEKQRIKQREIKKQQDKKPKQRTIQQMIATGNIDQSVRREMKKQIKAIRDKNKKKKHKSSRRKSRSRSSSSRSPEAKFSSDSQENKLPGYIQKEYVEPVQKPSVNQFGMQKQKKQVPLLYDPQLEQNQEVVINKKNYPKGSVLKLRPVDLQLSLKKKGKINFKSFMYSTQDYNKITGQIVDPGFSIIQLKRDKPDQQIIQYLSKPSRKKYTFLVGWFQSQKKQDNQFIRDFAIECNEKKKIYGVQNDHIKMHIMSINQYVKIVQLHDSPNKVTSETAVQALDKNRLVYVVQYPSDRMYQLKALFRGFNNVQLIENTYDVQVPNPSPIIMNTIPMPNTSYLPNPYMIGYNPLTPQQPTKTMVDENPLKPTVYEGWGSAQTTTPTYIAPNISYQNQNYNSLNQLSRFSPIMTDEQDNNLNEATKQKPQQKQIDLASNILDSLAKAPQISLTSRGYQLEPQRNEEPVYDYKRYQPMQPHPQHIAAGMGSMSMGNVGMHPQQRWQPTGMMPTQVPMGRVGMPMNPMSMPPPAYPMQPPAPSMMYKNPMNPMMAMPPYNYPPPPPQQKPPGSQYDPYRYQGQ